MKAIHPDDNAIDPAVPAPWWKTGKFWRQGILFVVAGLLLSLIGYELSRGHEESSASAMSSDSIPWQTDFDSALAQSRTTGKPVLVDFSAAWCGPCQMMKRAVWPDEQVGKMVRANYIPVLLDVDAPASHEAATRYQVDTIPAILVLDGTGKIIRRGSTMSIESLRQFLSSDAHTG